MDKVEEESREKRWYESLNLTQATGVLILIAMMIVLAGYLIYWTSPDRKYDIARPGKNDTNKATSVEDSLENDTSAIDLSDIQRKRKFLEDEQKALQSMVNFQPTSLSDQSLRLASPNDPSL